MSQAIAVSIFRTEHSNGHSNWVTACMDAEALVRRHNFELWAVSAGSALHNTDVRAYHVMGERSKPLGDAGHAAVRRELGELAHVYRLDGVRVAFGAVDTI